MTHGNGIDITLNDQNCRALLSEANLSNLARSFNGRKPRKGKQAVVVRDFAFFASGRISCSGGAFLGHYGTPENLEAAIDKILEGSAASNVRIVNVRLTHAVIDSIPPSSVGVELTEAATTEILAGNVGTINEMLTERVKHLRIMLVQRKEQMERYEQQQALEGARARLAKLDGLAHLRRLSPAAAKALQTVGLALRTVEGVSAEAQTYLEDLLIKVVDESEQWEKAVNAARRELQNEMAGGPPPGFMPHHMRTRY